VPTETPGYTATPIENKFAMRASVQCEIDFDNVRVPERLRLPAAEGLKAPFGCLNEARFGIAWGVTGVIRDCIDVATEYAQNRMLFGEPLAAKQITQDKLARMFVAYETSVLLALHLAGLKAKGAVDPVQISVAKYNNTRAAIDAARVAREILGGDGVTSDYPVMRHMANLEAVRTYEGTDEVHSLIIGRALTGHNAF
jgi:glutaryl-CoA dehydrogenase